MYLAKITFGAKRPEQSKDDLENAVHGYLSSLCPTSQISDDWFLTWFQGELIAHTGVRRPDSLKIRYHSDWGRKRLKALRDAFGREPQWELQDDDARCRFPSWKKAPFLVLFTYYDGEDASVRGGADGCPFPQYMLPLKFEGMREIYYWEKVYQRFHRIWLASSKWEIPAYRQIADPFSDLTRDGKGLCKEIEKATGIQTYYYLDRYYGRRDKEAEANRLCPSCGHKWRLKKPFGDESTGWCISYMCKPCRLVSRMASSGPEKWYASIGEYKNKAKG